ncbi:hypothetical protein Cob_v004382 [Colletotrichum orbiculare MAFF 240422]|uniref:Uncharacterized protein n=1 Tax=Colletotrichum orbiculare (strain 104-T / ATCC 96160 / CBS 514.97 / LARS 414 / MAFF 240422) TaxID=1213857 RepID=A0A484FZM2_COLOR|nr:hypothetical protein Cob_v004382 [Colletotrichum orbiculare MAFF 240422]
MGARMAKRAGVAGLTAAAVEAGGLDSVLLRLLGLVAVVETPAVEVEASLVALKVAEPDPSVPVAEAVETSSEPVVPLAAAVGVAEAEAEESPEAVGN